MGKVVCVFQPLDLGFVQNVKIFLGGGVGSFGSAAAGLKLLKNMLTEVKGAYEKRILVFSVLSRVSIRITCGWRRK